MAERFEGKVAIVTGGAGGVGQALVNRLVADGARVAAVDLREEDVGRVAREYSPGIVLGIAADVSTPEGVDNYVATTVQHFGAVHLFCNNAGILEKRQMPIVDLPIEDFDRVHAVNARGVFLGLKYVMRQMIVQGAGGAIVNTASMAALRARANAAAYGSSKQATRRAASANSRRLTG